MERAERNISIDNIEALAVALKVHPALLFSRATYDEIELATKFGVYDPKDPRFS